MISEITKGGVQRIKVTLCRSKVGVTVAVKTHPDIEEFFSSLASGRTVLVEAYGRFWQSIEPVGHLYAYAPALPSPANTLDDPALFTISSLGQPLLSDTGVVNLSFLRLVGSSEGAGVTFSLKGVSSWAGLEELRDKLTKALKLYYIQYMKPLQFTVTVSTQELPQ